MRYMPQYENERIHHEKAVFEERMPTLKKFINIVIQYITVLNNANDDYQSLNQFRYYFKDLNYHHASERFRKEVSEEIKLEKDTEELQDFFINLKQRENYFNYSLKKAMFFYKNHNILNPRELDAHFQVQQDIFFFKKLIQNAMLVIHPATEKPFFIDDDTWRTLKQPEKDKYDLCDSNGKPIPKPINPISAKYELKHEGKIFGTPIKLIRKIRTVC